MSSEIDILNQIYPLSQEGIYDDNCTLFDYEVEEAAMVAAASAAAGASTAVVETTVTTPIVERLV